MSENNFEEKFTAAYDKMMERIQHFFEESETNAIPTLKQRIELAKLRAIELREVTAEEADKIAYYVERDLHDAAEYLETTGKEFSTWFNFDLQLVEARLYELFASVADRTRLELGQLASQAQMAQKYHTGEVTGIGTLVCDSCGTEMHFKKTGRIPPCPKCHHTEFKRPPK
ncbi:MAG: zinc ribbon-containing protein [Methylophaga sp.]|uniref:zinc ribbon-containing protein n=1 Tax=Methylophaga sp. TaxID=2024840 RepID=UPI00299E37E5|nr:zinc ribbon-containing protein [Methylophaga sp.]MDX1749811.1 zinc ribbon-containing protein [Methylophaga sp.]